MRATVADLVGPGRRATAYGVFGAVVGAAAFLGGGLAGALYEISIPALIVATVVVQAAALVVLLLTLRRMRLERAAAGLSGHLDVHDTAARSRGLSNRRLLHVRGRPAVEDSLSASGGRMRAWPLREKYRSPSTRSTRERWRPSGRRCWATSCRRRRPASTPGTTRSRRGASRSRTATTPRPCWTRRARGRGCSSRRTDAEKQVKNRVHLDVRAAPGLEGDERMEALEAECERLVGLGGTRVERFEPGRPMSSGHIVMQDPEGNEFCLD